MTDYGKQFEGQLTKAFRACTLTPFAMRIKDGAQAEGNTTKNPADILVCGPRFNALIEAKATNGVSIRFDRVKGHQRRALVSFSRIGGGEQHVGFVALLFYNGKLGNARVYRAWLVEAPTWQLVHKHARRGRIEDSKGKSKARKSLPMEWLIDGTVPAIELVWVPGNGWDMDASLRAYMENRHV